MVLLIIAYLLWLYLVIMYYSFKFICNGQFLNYPYLAQGLIDLIYYRWIFHTISALFVITVFVLRYDFNFNQFIYELKVKCSKLILHYAFTFYNHLTSL